MSRLGEPQTGRSTATALLALLVLSSCASPGISTVPAAGPVSTTAPVAKPADPLAPASYRPVKRNGKEPKHTVSGTKGSLASNTSVRYRDGVTVTVARGSHRTQKGRGPGTFPGRPHTTFGLTVSNQSTKAVDLSQVVVTATYGSPAHVAAPVYEDSSGRDFSGTVAPRSSASATYAFAIPPGQRSKVVLVVDFDSLHVPATFTGSAK